MINLGAQYYRPPFPEERFWKDDLGRMVDAGLNTVQLWVLWGWVESTPAQMRFDDYDRLADLAHEAGLRLVLSTIAEIQPVWIHRVVPESELVTNMGQRVISSNRGECHFGLTPGGCFDHPMIWELMQGFLRATVERYRAHPALVGWDIWNELRWNVNADGLVCYCTHTLKRYREWLDQSYGGLDGLNRTWRTRYSSWQDIPAGKMPRSPYTLPMAFSNFMTWRSDRHAWDRYRVVKEADPQHPATVHGGAPSPLHTGGATDTALSRGNDWFFSERLDGVGTSSFPVWFGMDHANYAVRVGYSRSAAGGKLLWLSEVQGGRGAQGFEVQPSPRAVDQQRWIWAGLGEGADTILFWCWRDEVFGRESSGYGLAGSDGFAPERIEALRKTAAVLKRHEGFLRSYRMESPEVGVLFSPQTYYLLWSDERPVGLPAEDLSGYCRALVRANIPYVVVEEEHLDVLEGLKVLFLPRVLVASPRIEAALEEFVRAGGTMVAESECGAYDAAGIWRYPEDRLLARLTGVREAGRRLLSSPHVEMEFEGTLLHLGARVWLTPLRGDQEDTHGSPGEGDLLREARVGDGKVVLVGTHLGAAYLAGSERADPAYHPYCPDFERFLMAVCRSSGVDPAVGVQKPAAPRASHVHVRWGRSGDHALCFVITDPDAAVTLRLRHGYFGPSVRDLVSGREVSVHLNPKGDTCTVPGSPWGVAVLTDAPG